MKDYFNKFGKLKYKRSSLDTSLPQMVLWVDEDLVEDTPLRRSIDQFLTLVGLPPSGVEIVYSNQDDAIDEVESGLYSLVILDNDSYRGRAKGPATLQEIRKLDPDIPIVYTSDGSVDDRVQQAVSEVVATHEITLKMNGIIQKYILEEE
jgi:DNA-binding NtrC family response regulator